MPDVYDLRNNIDKAFEVAAITQRKLGMPYPDEVSFVMGFLACFGVITGNVDIGLPEGTPMGVILDNLEQDIADFGRRVAANQVIQDGVREAINGFKH
jgi:hypothetical protein